MLVEVTFVRDAHSVSEITPPTALEPDNVVAGAFIRQARAAFLVGIGAGTNAIAFTDLIDVPFSYVGQSEKQVRVKTDESGLEFHDAPTPPTPSFLDLTDTPDDYTGQAGKVAAVNGTEDGLDFFALPAPPTLPNFIDSIVETSGDVSLDNDSATPGASMMYATDALGARGWQPVPVQVPTGNYLVSGGGVAWTGTGLDYQVSAAVYVIGGVQHSSPQTIVTLAAADPSLDRIDVIAVDDSGAVVVLTGSPGGPPVMPQIDPATQLQLTFVYVPAGATIPPITNINIYLENTEWTSTVVGGTINPASTNNPYAGTKDIEGTNVAANQGLTLSNPSTPVKVSDFANLVLQIRSKAAWPSQKAIVISWVGPSGSTSVTLRNGTFGFNSSNTTSYQQIVIPASLFNTGSGLATGLNLKVSGGGANIGFYIDNIILQGGVTPPPPGGGDFSTNTNLSVADEMVLFADTSGKLGKRGPSVKAATQGNLGFNAKNVNGLVTGKIGGYWTCPYAGTISAWNLSVNAGTITVKIWKKATGTASPTSADSITPTGLSLTTGTSLHSTVLTGFSTLAVAAGDIFAVEITAVSGVNDMGGSVEITKS